MQISTYRLNSTGRWGVAFFVLPTPATAFYVKAVVSAAERSQASARNLDAILGRPTSFIFPNISPMVLTIAATLTLFGLVLLLIGREIVTTEFKVP
ncbi:hypothetical protein [Agrobacterium vitis]|uniref:hypothetical protein n=1 Tax=Agrobacterium vitis TaxID=373 RepID=UPI00115F922E|nr:hypothetical protein [Agrobacterium vitis]MUO83992.1 hypothetical protein [Agrobacterium vitis]